MTKQYGSLAAGMVLALALAPAAAFASDASLGAGLSEGARASTSVQAVGQLASSSTGVSVSASTTVNGKGAEVNVNAAAGQQTAENARMNNGAQVVLTQNAAGVTVTTPAQVQTQEDLSVYTHNAQAADAHVVAVQATEQNRVAVAYAHRAYLFGFIPVMATVTTSVTADASGAAQVTTSHPWWDFLATGDATVGATVKAALAGDTSIAAAVSGNASAAEKAAAVQAILDANVAASASASAGTQ